AGVLGAVDEFVRFFLLKQVIGSRLAAFFAGLDFRLFGCQLDRGVLGREGTGEDQFLVRTAADAEARFGPFFVGLVERTCRRFPSGAAADYPLATDQVRFPVVKVEPRWLRCAFSRLANASRPRYADLDLVVSDLGDFDLRDAELIAAGADDVDRPFHRGVVDGRLLRRRSPLQDQLHTALEIETQLRFL